jgi:nitrite reductase/ring-hydroxylating ferredoxin subunit
MGTLIVDVEELEPGGLLPVKVGERKVLVCRVGDEYFAIENFCPHATVPLSRGRLDDCVLECPFHGGKLDVRSGRPVRHPIRRPVATFAFFNDTATTEIYTSARAVP